MGLLWGVTSQGRGQGPGAVWSCSAAWEHATAVWSGSWVALGCHLLSLVPVDATFSGGRLLQPCRPGRAGRVPVRVCHVPSGLHAGAPGWVGRPCCGVFRSQWPCPGLPHYPFPFPVFSSCVAHTGPCPSRAGFSVHEKAVQPPAPHLFVPIFSFTVWSCLLVGGTKRVTEQLVASRWRWELEVEVVFGPPAGDVGIYPKGGYTA